VRQLDLGVGTFRRREKNQRELAGCIVGAPNLAQAETFAEEFQRRIDVAKCGSCCGGIS
jgi:hypothetical protein